MGNYIYMNIFKKKNQKIQNPLGASHFCVRGMSTNPQVKSLCSTGFGEREIMDNEAQTSTEQLDNCQLNDLA